MRWVHFALRSVTVLVAANALLCRAQVACDRQQQGKTAAEVLRMQRGFRSIKVGEMSTEVPDEIQRAMPQFKAAIAEAAREVLACHDAASDPVALETELAQLLHANPPQPPPSTSVKNGDPKYTEWSSSTYGSNLLLRVTKPSPTLLSVQYSFHVECGDDTVWLLFESRDGRWIERMIWQAPPYKEISGAFGDFFLTAILPGDAPGGWRAVAAHGTPWCTSRFSGFDLDVLSPTGQTDQPRLIWHTGRGYSRGDYESRLRVVGDGFEFRTNVPALSIDGYERTVVYRYRLTGDKVERVGPIATTARGFVEEWLESPWGEAMRFNEANTQTVLKAAHDRFSDNGKSKDAWTYSYGPVWACRDNSKHFQVELEVDDPHTGDRASYYQVRENGEGYTMMSADSARPDMRCAGPDLMKKQ